MHAQKLCLHLFLFFLTASTVLSFLQWQFARPYGGTQLVSIRRWKRDVLPDGSYISKTCFTGTEHFCKGCQGYQGNDLASEHPITISYAEGAGSSNRSPTFQEKIEGIPASLWEAAKMFPWGKIFAQFSVRALHLAWIVSKWLGIPFLVLSTVWEIMYTLASKKHALIPLGMGCGIVISRIAGKSALEVLKVIPNNETPWPLFIMATLFGMLKILGPHYPHSMSVFLPHFATAALVQTFLYLREWQHMPRPTHSDDGQLNLDS